jgi:hypothetical protein
MAQSVPWRHVRARQALIADLQTQLRLAREHIHDSRSKIAAAQATMQTTRDLLARIQPVAMMGCGEPAGGIDARDQAKGATHPIASGAGG